MGASLAESSEALATHNAHSRDIRERPLLRAAAWNAAIC
jgi:hypothetical protein